MNVIQPPIELNPTSTAKHSVIWLHGLGADGSDFVPIVSELNIPDALALRFIFPHAPIMPVTINNGYQMRAWFDIYDMKIDSKIDEKGISNAVAIVNTLIANEEARGIATENIVLAGFSQGAVIALTTMLLQPQKLAGVIALSGYLPLFDTLIKKASSLNKSTPIFIAHGTEDNIVPHALGRATYQDLHLAGYPVEWHAYRMPHSVCAEEIRDISAWLQHIFNQK